MNNTEYKPESRFLASRQNTDCRDPSLWHSADRSATEQEVAELVAALVRAVQPELVIETGACRGHTSYLIGKALVQNGHGRAVCIEMIHRLARRAAQRCSGLPVEVVASPVQAWHPEDTDRIDMAYFDSSLEDRVPSFHHLRPWMTLQTIVAFHDSGPQHPLRPGLLCLADAGWIQPVFLPTPRGICIGRVSR